MTGHVEYEGLEHLAQLKSKSVPVIVAGFHFSTTKLLALLLMRRGYDAMQIWMPDGSVDMDSITKRLAEFDRDLPEYGKLSIIPDFSLPSYRRLLKSLREGSTLVWFADMFGSKERSDGKPATQEWCESAAKVFDFGQIRTELAQSKLEVTLCGQQVYLNPWIGGFARSAGASVIPAALIRQRKGMRMILLPPLRLEANATAKHGDSGGTGIGTAPGWSDAVGAGVRLADGDGHGFRGRDAADGYGDRCGSRRHGGGDLHVDLEDADGRERGGSGVGDFGGLAADGRGDGRDGRGVRSGDAQVSPEE